jgi:hypothetical protein
MARKNSDSAIIASIIEDVNFYSKKYKCDLNDAFIDVIAEYFTLTHHAKEAAKQLGLTFNDSWFKMHTKETYQEKEQDYYDYNYDGE